MSKVLEILEREDGCLSIGRICALLTFLLWLAATIFLLFTGKSFAHYDTFTMAALGFLLVQVCNKAVECRLFKAGGEKQ